MPAIEQLLSDFAENPGQNAGAMLGLGLLAVLGIDRLTRAILFLLPVTLVLRQAFKRLLGAARWLREALEEGDPVAYVSTLAYYLVAFVLSLILAVQAELKLVALFESDVPPWIDYVLSAVVIATGGEGMSQLLELGEPGASTPQPAPEQPIEIRGAISLEGVAGIPEAGHEG